MWFLPFMIEQVELWVHVFHKISMKWYKEYYVNLFFVWVLSWVQQRLGTFAEAVNYCVYITAGISIFIGVWLLLFTSLACWMNLLFTVMPLEVIMNVMYILFRRMDGNISLCGIFNSFSICKEQVEYVQLQFINAHSQFTVH